MVQAGLRSAAGAQQRKQVQHADIQFCKKIRESSVGKIGERTVDLTGFGKEEDC